MRKPKWHLITHVSETGLIRLINDVNEFYKGIDEFQNPEFHIRTDKFFGPYQVNILTKDWDGMMLRKSEDEFASRYKEVVE